MEVDKFLITPSKFDEFMSLAFAKKGGATITKCTMYKMV